MRFYVANITDEGVRVVGAGIRGELLTHDEFAERSVANWVEWKSGKGNTFVLRSEDPYTDTLIQTRFQLR